MMSARAWERLHDPEKNGTLDSEAFYELCREAGYSEEESQKAATLRANARMDRNLKP